ARMHACRGGRRAPPRRRPRRRGRTRSPAARPPARCTRGATAPKAASSCEASSRRAARGSLHRSQELDDRLSDGVEAAHRDRREVVAAAVPARELEVDQVDRRHALACERVVVVEHRTGRARGEERGDADAGGRAPQLLPERRVGARLPREREVSVADEVEQDHRPRLAVDRCGDPGAADPVGQELAVRLAGRHLLAVEREEDDRRPDRPRQLDEDGGTGGAVVRADEAGQILRVVVGGDDDVAARIAAADEADDVAEAAGDGLVGPARERRFQLRRQLPRGRRARRARAEPHLRDEPRPRRVPVEAVDARPGRGCGEGERGCRERDQIQRLYRKNATIATSVPTIPPTMIQNAWWVPSPGKPTFMPKIPASSESGSIVTLKIVRIRRTSFWRWEITDSFVSSRASTTSL